MEFFHKVYGNFTSKVFGINGSNITLNDVRKWSSGFPHDVHKFIYPPIQIHFLTREACPIANLPKSEADIIQSAVFNLRAGSPGRKNFSILCGCCAYKGNCQYAVNGPKAIPYTFNCIHSVLYGIYKSKQNIGDVMPKYYMDYWSALASMVLIAQEAHNIELSDLKQLSLDLLIEKKSTEKDIASNFIEESKECKCYAQKRLLIQQTIEKIKNAHKLDICLP